MTWMMLFIPLKIPLTNKKFDTNDTSSQLYQSASMTGYEWQAVVLNKILEYFKTISYDKTFYNLVLHVMMPDDHYF